MTVSAHQTDPACLRLAYFNYAFGQLLAHKEVILRARHISEAIPRITVVGVYQIEHLDVVTHLAQQNRSVPIHFSFAVGYDNALATLRALEYLWTDEGP